MFSRFTNATGRSNNSTATRQQQQQQQQRQLQCLPSAKEMKDGCLIVKPLSVGPSTNNNFNDNNHDDEELFKTSLGSGGVVITISVSGQTRSCKLQQSSSDDAADVRSEEDEKVIVAAPLRHLYHSQLNIQAEFSSSNNNNNKIRYRGSIPVDEISIHQTNILKIDLQRKQEDLVLVAGSSSSSSGGRRQPAPVAAEDDSLLFPNNNNITIQLECQLQGPYRNEISKAKTALDAWLMVIDKVEDTVTEVWKKISPSIPNAAKKKEAALLLIPAMFGIMIPTILACLIVSPIVIGFCILFFPIMIPLVVGICLVIALSVLTIFVIVTTIYCSSRYGRQQLVDWWKVQTTIQQYWDIIRGAKFGFQTLIYETGPRPTPVTITRTQMPREKWRRLGVSLTIDGVGSFSYLLPFIGEAFDVVWAPTQTVLIMALYQHVSPNMSYVSFAEEMLPFLDVLPSATTGWLMEFGPEILDDVTKLVTETNINPKDLSQMILWGTTNQNNNNSNNTPPPPPRPRRPSSNISSSNHRSATRPPFSTTTGGTSGQRPSRH